MIEPSTQFALWHGIVRDTIPWFPTVDHGKCIGCELCFVTCGRGVYDVLSIHPAGEFGEKRFLVKLEGIIKDRPFDMVNLKLEVPTLKGALEQTPSHMSFGVTSTDQ